MRQFRDAAGVDWRVYQTERKADAEQRRDHLLPVEYRHGWLVFEAATEKRRLAPVPEGWSELPDDALAALCASAAVQTRRAKTGGSRASRDAANVKHRPRSERTAGAEPQPSVASELSAVEQRLTEKLDEVCDAGAVEKLDTGELIRVEETLTIAAEAAKKAVSLRRKRRSTALRREQPGRGSQERRD